MYPAQMENTMSERHVAQRFDGVAPGYDEANANWPPSRMIARLIELAEPDPTDRVLDIGTGTGRLALAIAPLVRSVVGIDVSDGMLSHARRKARDLGLDNVSFLPGSFTRPDLSDTFDIVVSSLAFEWVPDAEKREAVERMKTLLAPSGRLIIGERMLFVDPQKEPERASKAVARTRQLHDTPIARGGRADHVPPVVPPEQLAAAMRFRDAHQELRLRPRELGATCSTRKDSP